MTKTLALPETRDYWKHWTLEAPIAVALYTASPSTVPCTTALGMMGSQKALPLDRIEHACSHAVEGQTTFEKSSIDSIHLRRY